MTIPISVLILTKNEAKDLPGCLDSVAWSDDVHVYDSLSEDATVTLATAYGAKVTQRPFDNWAAHQNWALENIAFKYPWVFYLDADERTTPELVQSMKSAVQTSGDQVAYRIQRRDFFMGEWLKHVQTSSYYMRLFRPEKMRYERLVNPVSIPEGPVGQIGGYLDHYPFSKGIWHWLDRHNKYSTQEALQIIGNRSQNVPFSFAQAFVGKDFHTRRFHQKEIFYRMPCRPVIKFLLLYVLKRGFMDGRPGLTYALLQSIYEYMIVLKTNELENPDREMIRAVPGEAPRHSMPDGGRPA